MKATIATFLLALGLISTASIMLRGTLSVFFCTVVVSLLWAFAGAGFLGLKRFEKPRVSFAFSVSLSLLVLVGMLNLPLRIAFRIHEDEFNRRLMDGVGDLPRGPWRSTWPFKVISKGERGNTNYFLLDGDQYEVHGFVHVRQDEFYNLAAQQKNLGLRNYNLGSETSLGNGWWYVEED